MASEAEDNPKSKSLDDFITNILMKENEDAQGFLLNVVPIVLRINIFIVNIDTSTKARVNSSLIFQNNPSIPKFNIQECKAKNEVSLKATDNLNFQDHILYVIRKDAHYDRLYKAEKYISKIAFLKDCDLELKMIEQKIKNIWGRE